MTNVNPYRKRLELAVIGVETTRGTAAPKKFAFPWLNKNVRSIPNVIENESAVGLATRVNDSAIDVWHSEGPLGGKVTEENFPVLLHGMFEKVTTTAIEEGGEPTGFYEHVFERDPSVARKTLSLWDVRPSGTRLFKSLYMDNLGLSIEVGDSGAWLQCSTAVKGWKHEDVSSVTPPSIDPDLKEFTSRMVKIYLADDVAGLANESARIKPRQVDINFEETVTPDHYLGETNNDPEFDSAAAEAKGSMVVKYRSTDFEDGYFTNKVHAMKIVAENGEQKIEITGTKVRFRELTDSDGINDVVSQTISFFFESDLDNGGKDVVVKVTNKVASFTS